MLRKLIALIVILAALAGGGAFAVWRGMHEPYRAFAGEEVFVELPQGARTADIATLLADAGVVRNAVTFRLAVRMAKADRKLKAGEYRFLEAATPDQVIKKVLELRRIFPTGLVISPSHEAILPDIPPLNVEAMLAAVKHGRP